MQTQNEEMIGVLTAMSIVAKRLAKQLMRLEEEEEMNEQNETSIKCSGGFKKSSR
jgi:hypothetical protein